MRKIITLCVKISRMLWVSVGCGCLFARFQAERALGIGIADVFPEMF
jgi:hypothetical protein